MAQKRIKLDQETFSCCICLDLLKDPVTIPCGHSYCMNCIDTHWDKEDEEELHSCPQCRQTFTPRPDLVKNTVLADVVEQLKKTGLQAAAADHCYAGPEDVACDVCTGKRLKAIKSCLVCLVSYCEKHLQPHLKSPAFENHKLVNPSKKLHVCSRHNEVMKMFCRTDQQCICYICLIDDHIGHEAVSAAAERTERQRELEGSRLNIQQRIQDREKDVKLLHQEVEDINLFADKTVEDSEKIFSELIRLLERRSSDVKQQVRYKQRIEVRRVKELQEKLEQELAELKRNDAELQKLSHTEDLNQFLHNYPSLSPLRESADSSSINTHPLRYFEDVLEDLNRFLYNYPPVSSPRESADYSSIKNPSLRYFRDVTGAVSEVSEEVQDVLKEKWTNISLMGPEVIVLTSQPEPMTRGHFLWYSRDITLDPNTANSRLLLSHGNRKVTLMSERESYPSHPDRFTQNGQVLSRERLTGRCYWEVKWSGIEVTVAVAYKSICRNGSMDECKFGGNNKSWALWVCKSMYNFIYKDVYTPISGPQSYRVGVYLDHRAGRLSFYSVSETMTLIHRVETTFTQPVYVGFGPSFDGTSAELCKLK